MFRLMEMGTVSCTIRDSVVVIVFLHISILFLEKNQYVGHVEFSLDRMKLFKIWNNFLFSEGYFNSQKKKSKIYRQ